MLLLAALVGPAAAQTPLQAADALLERYHEDLRDLDRARDVLAAAAERESDPAVLTTLARAWFLIGEFRARGDEQRLAAYERGRDAGRRAVALAPRSERAHVWYALNQARWAETRGLVRALAAVRELRGEAQVILSLDAASVEGHALAGGLDAELPGMLGGDRARAEAHFRRALEADPHRTGARIELARLLIAMRRPVEAQEELRRVLDEPEPSDRPYWALRDVPRARALLESLGIRPESP
jgi:tetratricopeptide (TPR) repeat protein